MNSFSGSQVKTEIKRDIQYMDMEGIHLDDIIF